MVVYKRCRIRLKSQNTKAATLAIVVLKLTSVYLASSREPTDKFDTYTAGKDYEQGTLFPCPALDITDPANPRKGCRFLDYPLPDRCQ